MSKPSYFLDTTSFGINTPLTTSFVFYAFGFPVKSQIIVAPESTNSDVIFFSYDGSTIAGRLSAADASVNISKKGSTGIWLKGNSVSQHVRVWGN